MQQIKSKALKTQLLIWERLKNMINRLR